MSAINTYLLRGASAGELHAALVDASAGKGRPFAWGLDRFDEARVRLPYPETAPGVADAETGELTPVPTGSWLCEIRLVGEVDADLALIAQSLVTEAQAASG
ncbi:hypothetical protein [Parvibaculum sp.]|uniref:hypothetical protein n=1 Tax=Parvibaculum sp. TaxID=2024848 RepID=UPI00320F60C3